MSIVTKEARRLKRRRRVRAKVRGTAVRPAHLGLRSNRGIQAQLVDGRGGRNARGRVWTEPRACAPQADGAASRAGELLAERAKSAG
jgi:large subunit ribosomal protein L18